MTISRTLIGLVMVGLLTVEATAFKGAAPLPVVKPPLGYIPSDDDVDDPSLLNMGVLGARVKTDHLEERYPRSKSSSGTVAYIYKNSPAEQLLRLGDVVVGVEGQRFHKDFSARLAEAIGRAEAGEGKLDLLIERDGAAKTVTFQLKKMGQYSSTWPYECEKSQRILQDACDWLVAHQLPSGSLEKTDGDLTFVLSSVGGLAMLGCDADRYAEPLQRIVAFELNHLKSRTQSDGHYHAGILELWSLNYAAIFLSEYYLATEDKEVLPALEFLNKEIFYRQFHQVTGEVADHIVALRKERGDKGDPLPDYWFSHGELSTKSNGYIHLGVNVANACVAWSLLDLAGVDIDRENLKATKDYIEKACTVGTMGYASTLGQRRHPRDAFGRTGVLAVALHLDNDRPAYMEKVRLALNKHARTDFYFSHATCVMGKAWGVLGMAHLDPAHFRELMDWYRNDFELLRLSDGSFVSNAASKNGHGILDIVRGGNGQHHRWTTAYNALIYALGNKSLRIAGAVSNR